MRSFDSFVVFGSKASIHLVTYTMQPGSMDPVPWSHHSTHPLLAAKKQQVLVRPSHMQRRFPKPGGLGSNTTDIRTYDSNKSTNNKQPTIDNNLKI